MSKPPLSSLSRTGTAPIVSLNVPPAVGASDQRAVTSTPEARAAEVEEELVTGGDFYYSSQIHGVHNRALIAAAIRAAVVEEREALISMMVAVRGGLRVCSLCLRTAHDCCVPIVAAAISKETA